MPLLWLGSLPAVQVQSLAQELPYVTGTTEKKGGKMDGRKERNTGLNLHDSGISNWILRCGIKRISNKRK